MAKKPTIRFQGHQDDWQEKRFDEIATLRRGLTYTPSDIDCGVEQVKVLRSSNIEVDTFVQNKDDVIVDKSCVNIPTVKEGDILITAANGSTNLVGKHAVIRGLKMPTVHGGFMLLAETQEPEFVNASMSSEWYNKFIKLFVAGGNGAIGNLNRKDLEEATLLVPNEQDTDERKEIGNFFATLDKIISLRETELEKLKQLKAACLDKMFANGGGKSEPTIRFAGYTDRWREMTMAECFTISKEKNSEDIFKREDVLSVSGDFGIVNQIAFQGRSFAGESISNYRVVRNGYVVYTKSPLKSNPFGIIKASHNMTGIVSPLYATYIPNEETDPLYTEQYFSEKSVLNNYLRPLVNKGAKNTLLITDETALQGIIRKPKLDEQRVISQFINKIDKVILLRTKELTKLRNLKQACLHKMFAA